MLTLDIWLVSVILFKILIYISAFMAAGTMLYLIVMKPDDAMKRSLCRMSFIMGLIAMVATALNIPLQTGQMLDAGFKGMFDREMLSLIMGEGLGISSLMRAIGLIVLITAAFIASMRPFFVVIGAVLVCLSFAYIGHTTQYNYLVSVVLMLHLLAISYWMGVLWPLYRLSASHETRPGAALVAKRFGTQALFIVTIVIISGLILAVIILGGLQALFTSFYGWILIVKITSVGLLLSVAALNKLYFVPALFNADDHATKNLRSSICLEAFVFVFIFVLIAYLTTAINLPS